MREKYSHYEYAIEHNEPKEYTYKIFMWNDYYGSEEFVESNEWYDTEQEARLAAINYIQELESGER